MESLRKLRQGPRQAEIDCNAFPALLAKRYFSLTADAVRAADPHHLVIGCRFPIIVPIPVRQALTAHCDVVSINSYAADPSGDIHVYDDTGRPALIGEFTFRGADAGLPNFNKGLPIVPTKKDRVESTATYLEKAFAQPSVVGAHWFQYVDQPKEDRGIDGENSNVGLVNIDDQPYPLLVGMFKELNPELPRIYRTGAP